MTAAMQSLYRCWEYFPGPRDQRKRLATPDLHQEFIKRHYRQKQFLGWQQDEVHLHTQKGIGYYFGHLEFVVYLEVQLPGEQQESGENGSGTTHSYP